MKILYLTDQIYLHGGIEKVLSQKANYLADVSGEEVFIITHNQQCRKPVYDFSDKIQMLDLGVDYEIGKSYFHPTNLKKIPHHRRSLLKVLRQLQPDVVISCSFGPDFYFLPYIEKHIPKIKEFHATRFFSSKVDTLKAKIMKSLSDYIETKFTRLVILNEDERGFYKSENISVIPNPAELDNNECSLEKKTIISAGRISYQKNFEDLIEIGRNIFCEFPEWELHIYGDDYSGKQKSLQKSIDNYNLKKYILFKGTTSDLKKTFLDYSIYVMTSNHETFPMVLLEALSVGLPIVSYDCPTGPSRIITDNEDSFLIPYKNLDIFTTQLKTLMADESLRIKMGCAGRRNVQRFAIDKVMQQWQDLFAQLSR
ncbi:MAG: glycosyltransferase family 4 protein [Lutibacter sp.]